MWLYHQSTGELLKPDRVRLAFGFAGNGNGLNNPAMQDQRNVGPLPQGDYSMFSWIEKDARLGLCVIVLVANPHNSMFGRSGFRIHGYRNLERSGLSSFLHSSDGCICIGSCVERRAIWQSGDHALRVAA